MDDGRPQRVPDHQPGPTDFTIQWVQNDAELWVWKLAQDAGFEGDKQIYYDAYAKDGYGPQAAARHYVGFQDGQPVTSGTLLLSEGSPASTTCRPHRTCGGAAMATPSWRT